MPNVEMHLAFSKDRLSADTSRWCFDLIVGEKGVGVPSSGHTWTLAYYGFWVAGAEDPRNSFHSDPISGGSWPDSQDWLNLAVWYLLLLVVRREVQKLSRNLPTWPDSDFTRGSCQLCSWTFVFWYMYNHPHVKKRLSNEGAHACARMARTWLQILLKDLLQCLSFRRRKLRSLNLASLKAIKVWFFNDTVASVVHKEEGGGNLTKGTWVFVSLLLKILCTVLSCVCPFIPCACVGQWEQITQKCPSACVRILCRERDDLCPGVCCS